jgi:hypothetical protein
VQDWAREKLGISDEDYVRIMANRMKKKLAELNLTGQQMLSPEHALRIKGLYSFASDLLIHR